MKVKIEYTTEVSDEFRRAINMQFGRPGLASREQVREWVMNHGTERDESLMQDYFEAIEDGTEQPLA